jgi:hypothetical protein
MMLPAPTGYDRISVEPLALRDPLSHPLFERELAQRYFLFDAWVEGNRRVNLHPLVLSPELHNQAINAATAAARLIDRVAERALSDTEEAARYRFSADVQRLAQAAHRAGDGGRLVRVDLLLSESGWQACEINADCPGGHNEALGLPRLAQAAGFSHGHNPTTVVEDLASELMAMRDGEGAIALIYATAYAEDLQVCALIQRELKWRGAPTILASPTALRRRGRRLYVGDQRVSVLYRYFPTEFMEGQRNLADIAAVVADGGVRCLSSFAAIYSQSKQAFARAHALRAEFSPDDARALAYLPRTYALADLPAGELLAAPARFVLKRALGRVGEEVFVGSLLSAADWEKAVAMATSDCESGEVWVVQEFVPQRRIESPYGPLLVTLGVYVLNGSFAGYFARLTPESHASHSALCLPVFVQLEESSTSGRSSGVLSRG